MASKLPITLPWVVAAVVAALPQLAAAEFERSVARLLETGWQRSSQSLAAAQQQFDELRQTSDDPRLLYAQALVLLKHRRYDEASALLNKVLAADPKHLPARRAKAWIEMLKKEYSAALVDLDVLARDLPEPKPGKEPDPAHLEAARFLGRMFGFLEGPAQGAVTANTVEPQQEKLLARWTSAYSDAFEESRQGVLRQFEELDLEQDQTKAEAKADQEQQKARELEALAEQKSDLVEEQRAISDQAEQTRKEYGYQLKSLDRDISPLRPALARLESRANSVARDVVALRVNIDRLLDLSDETEDPDEAYRYRAEARRLDFVLSRRESELDAVRAEGAALTSRLHELVAQRNAILARQQAELNALGRRSAEIARTSKRIQVEEGKTSRPATGNTPRVRSLSAGRTALTTYDQFPLESERQRVLDSLR